MLNQSLFLIISDILSKAVFFLFQIVLARRLGPEIFGVYAVVTTLSSIFLVFSNYGLDVLVAREVDTARNETSKYLWNLTVIKIPIALGVVLAMFLTAVLLNYSRQAVLCAVLAAVATVALSYSRLTFGFFRAFGVLRYEALITASDRLLSSFVCIGLILSGFGLIGIFSVSAAVSLLTVFVSYLMIRRFILARSNYSFDALLIKKIISGATPLLFLGIFSVIYFQIDIIMLSLMKGDSEVGLYSSIIRFLSLFQFVPGAVVGVLLPLMSEQFTNRDSGVLKSLMTGTKYMFLLGVSAAAVIFLFAGTIITVLYSGKFMSAELSLKILIWSLPFYLMNPILGNFLIAANRQILPVAAVILTSMLNIALNMYLIPAYSLTGAAASTLICEFFLFLSQGYFSLRVLSRNGMGFDNAYLSAMCRFLYGKEAV